MAATIEIMSWMGPQPDDVPWETYTGQITPMLSIGFLALQRSATNDILATGQMSSSEMTEIRQALSAWSEQVDHLERQYGLLRVEHGKLIDYLQQIVPGSHIVSDDPALGGFTRSRFPFSHQTTLSNPRLEGLLSVYLIRQSFVLGDFRGFMESQSEVLAIIEATNQD